MREAFYSFETLFKDIRIIGRVSHHKWEIIIIGDEGKGCFGSRSCMGIAEVIYFEQYFFFAEVSPESSGAFELDAFDLSDFLEPGFPMTFKESSSQILDEGEAVEDLLDGSESGFHFRLSYQRPVAF
jgi:hypothetical protein